MTPDVSGPSAPSAVRLRSWLELPTATGPSVTYDGTSVLFVGTANGIPEVWAAPTAVGAARRLFASSERIGSVDASPAGPQAVVAVDAGGNEHWQLSVLDLENPARGPQPLAHDPHVIHQPGAWSTDGGQYRYAANSRDPRFFDIFERSLDGSPPRLLLSGDATHFVRDVLGDRTLVQRSNTNLDSDLLLLEGDSTTHLSPHDGELDITAAVLRPDGVYAAANPGKEFTALLKYRYGNPKHEFLAEYPGDVEILAAAPVGDLLALVVNREGWSETRLFDTVTREDRVVNSGPRGVISSLSWFPDGSALVYALSTVDGVDLYRRTVATGKEKRLTGTPGTLPGSLALPRLGKLRASDGLTVPYWEYAPTSRPRGTILWIHGGPEGQARPQFSPVLGFLVSDGWRVVAPNIRGSTGYGRTYVHLDDVRKRMESVRDVHDLAEDLIKSGKAERGRLAIVGGSYGGFVVLSAAATYPDLWGAAIDLVGIANFVTFLENTGPWRRHLRESEYGSLEHDRKFLEEISPLHHASQILAPLLVIHGRNDPRVPLSEAEQIVASLRQRRRPVELLVFDNEGHGIVRRENQLVAWGRAVEFLAEHLGGPAPAPTKA